MSCRTLLLGAIAASIGSLIAAGCGGSDAQGITQGTVIRNATVVDTRDGSLKAGMSVVVDGGRIVKVTDRPVVASGTATTVDATGKYVVPGLLDMHTHLFDADATQQALAAKMMLANGITGVREMRGSAELVQATAQLNAGFAAGTVDAPEILVIPGEIIGNPVPLLSAAATTAAGAVAEVQRQKAYGAGFIKVTNANRDASLALLAEARNQGLHVAGHLSPALSARDSSNAGWRAVEHLGSGIGTLLDCSTQEDSVRAALLSGAGGATPGLPPTWAGNVANAPLFQRVHDSYDATKCQAVAQTFAKNGTWFVPTLIRLRTQRFIEDTGYRADPNLAYVSKATRASWEASALARLAFPATAIDTYHQYYAREQPLPRLLKDNGVKLLAGSDTSTVAPWVIPGFSLHQEFALLAAGGLTPLEILQMATLNGAEFLGRQATMGTVEEGRNADLVLLDANPIADVANLSRISAVFLRGRHFPKEALDKLKANVAAAHASQQPQALKAAEMHDHED